ncbi:MAG: response regulator [Rhodothermales bacterium]|nr:response regulator [Rhodothermales bacterium]
MSSDDRNIRVWLVEDDREYRDTALYILGNTTGISCEATFHSVEQMVTGWSEGRKTPDVILMDVGLPGQTGLEGARWVKAHAPQTPVVMLTIQDSADVIYSALRAGASGYILKDTPIDKLVAAIRAAAAGGTLMSAPVATKVLGFFSSQDSRSDFGLTDRELEVLTLMAEGLPHAQIAERLYLSGHTVENHLRSIYRKLHVSSGLQAVVKAMRSGIV